MARIGFPYISNKDLPSFISSFKKYIKDIPEFNEAKNVLDNHLVTVLGRLMQNFLADSLKLESQADQQQFGEWADLRKPWLWYPIARSMKRRIIVHTGPTNSGKTHAALEKLIAAGTGIYCGPLRLLAHEVYEKLISRGVVCSLVTGQQKIETAMDTHVACTIEMANVNVIVDVAVVDEYQMLGGKSKNDC
jgi:hypothetical protein